jgi:hypothetical protein
VRGLVHKLRPVETPITRASGGQILGHSADWLTVNSIHVARRATCESRCGAERVMEQTGFLAPWLRDLGAAVGLVVGIIAACKAFFEWRPFSYVEPDRVDGFLKLFVFNAGKRSIVVNGSHIFPRKRWYIAINAPNITSAGRQHSWYGAPESGTASWHSHNVIIGPGKSHEFFLGLVNRNEKPTGCLVLMSWQPLGGLPLPRPPLLLQRRRTQIERLFRARKGNHDRDI